MRSRWPRDHSHLELLGLTGWLFADLLLAIAMVFLLSQRGGEAVQEIALVMPTATPLPSATATATATPRPSPSPTTIPTPVQGLQDERREVALMVDAAALLGPAGTTRDRAIEALHTQVREKFAPLEGAHAAIVVTFAGALSGGERQYQRAEQLARVVNAELGAVYPEMFENTATEALHDLNDPFGALYMWVWFFLPSSPAP